MDQIPSLVTIAVGWNGTDLRQVIKCILSDWWGSGELYDLSPEEALSKLVQICQDPDVYLRPLAKQLENLSTGKVSPRQLGEIQGEER